MKSRNSYFKRNEKQAKHSINYDIKASEVRLINSDNTPIGIRSRSEALSIAELKHLDLVEIAPKANPPVWKLIDYGKFLYEQQKKEKLQKKNQSQKVLKEIRFKSRTATHDFNFKLKHARGFIAEGSKVKAFVMFRGRELAHTDIGKELLVKFVEAMSDIAKIDSPISNEGRNMSVTLSPLKGASSKKSKKTSTEDKKEEKQEK